MPVTIEVPERCIPITQVAMAHALPAHGHTHARACHACVHDDVDITTDRLLLRRWRDSDREPWAAACADPEVMRHFPDMLTREQSDAMIERIGARFAAHGFGLWAVERRAERDFIGFVGLQRITWAAPFTPATEIGWRLARAAWGAGYATEAARAVVDHAFDELDLEELVSVTVPANARSRAVMERIGMVHDAAGDFDHPRVPAGHPLRRHVLYRLGNG
jgi:RimJ/RimL family protein N-acetyltransferase